MLCEKTYSFRMYPNKKDVDQWYVVITVDMEDKEPVPVETIAGKQVKFVPAKNITQKCSKCGNIECLTLAEAGSLML